MYKCAQNWNWAVSSLFGEKNVMCPEEILSWGSFEITNVQA